VSTTGRPYSERVTGEGIHILELDCVLDQPKRPRDFDFEGDTDAMVQELRQDSMEYLCFRYLVWQTFDDCGGGLWAVWRDQP
jgi:hypothetical protein